nr:PREDICTED: interferon regulatory factor 4-like [Latimeria chalumnae]|eukprot:XP_014351730.1 PREDICTED: interferon regulatory factor 4-like [Latimeria chalumnae]
MSDGCGSMKLRQWLITQIDSGLYPGLRWENREKNLFRIPWKHAAKQDYNQDEDAALFKAWAIYKGKHQEGKDKADPSTWKTRLRCALNKSTDFQEVPERSQLDISEPYKVYQILPEGGKKPEKIAALPSNQDTTCPKCQKQETTSQCQGQLQTQSSSPDMGQEDYKEIIVGASSYPIISKVHSQQAESGLQVQGIFYSWAPMEIESSEPPVETDFKPPRNAFEPFCISDLRLHVRLYYQGTLVKDFVTRTADGCRITHGHVPVVNEKIYGSSTMEEILFPSPHILTADDPRRLVEVMERLLPHLERGVILWLGPEGVFAKRLCQGRVYWNGPLAPFDDQPNKLDREITCKLLDTQQFLQELQVYMHDRRTPPRYQIDLCFGEEYPDPPSQRSRKLIMAQVEPIFARKLFHCAEQMDRASLQSLQFSNPGSDNLQRILWRLCQS